MKECSLGNEITERTFFDWKAKFQIELCYYCKDSFLIKKEMKATIQIIIELVFLAAAIYAKYIDESLSTSIEEIPFVDSLSFF